MKNAPQWCIVVLASLALLMTATGVFAASNAECQVTFSYSGTLLTMTNCSGQTCDVDGESGSCSNVDGSNPLPGDEYRWDGTQWVLVGAVATNQKTVVGCACVVDGETYQDPCCKIWYIKNSAGKRYLLTGSCPTPECTDAANAVCSIVGGDPLEPPNTAADCIGQ